MAQTVLITLTTAGSDTGPFELYSDADSYGTPFEVGIAKSSLVGGYTSTLVPDAAIFHRFSSESADVWHGLRRRRRVTMRCRRANLEKHDTESQTRQP